MVQKPSEPIIIKKYANRRLYNTATSGYITLEDLRLMVKNGDNFVVQDAKTGADLTRFVLTQVIFEQESKGYSILPENFLRQLICFYDDSLSSVLTQYLDSTMNMFTQNQENLRNSTQNPFEALNPMKNLEGITQKNMKIFDDTLKAFTSFNRNFAPEDNKPKDGDDTT